MIRYFQAKSQCKNLQSTVATCVILLLGYLMLVIAGAICFLLIRSENSEKSMFFKY